MIEDGKKRIPDKPHIPTILAFMVFDLGEEWF